MGEGWYCKGTFLVYYPIHLLTLSTKYHQGAIKVAKSKQNNHEYYSNAETCRNRLFDTYRPKGFQNEDFHLDYYQEEEEEDDE